MSALFALKVGIVLALVALWTALVTRCRRRRPEILCASAAFCLSLLAAELIVRRVYPQFDNTQALFRPDRELGWAFVPAAAAAVVYPGEAHHFVTINSDGFRDTTRPGFGSGTQRIALIGDSFTSNVSVPEERLFTTLMEESMPDVEVMNFGVNGYSQVQELLLLDRVLPVYRPDLVIVMLYVRNDVLENINADWQKYARPYARSASGTLEIVTPASQPVGSQQPEHFEWRLQRHSQLYQLLYTRANWLLERHRGGEGRIEPSSSTPPELYLCLPDPLPDIKKAYAVQEQLLLQIAQTAAAADTPLLFVIAPTIVQVHEQYWDLIVASHNVDPADYDLTYPNKRLLAFAAEHGLPMVDLLPALREAAATGMQLYFPQEQHWNGAGNRVVADVLKSRLQKEIEWKK